MTVGDKGTVPCWWREPVQWGFIGLRENQLLGSVCRLLTWLWPPIGHTHSIRGNRVLFYTSWIQFMLWGSVLEDRASQEIMCSRVLTRKVPAASLSGDQGSEHFSISYFRYFRHVFAMTSRQLLRSSVDQPPSYASMASPAYPSLSSSSSPSSSSAASLSLSMFLSPSSSWVTSSSSVEEEKSYLY